MVTDANVNCQIKREGMACGESATHHWGPVRFCCDHFDQFIASMFDLNAEAHRELHREFVAMFELRTKQRSSRIYRAKCTEGTEDDDPTKLPDKQQL